MEATYRRDGEHNYMILQAPDEMQGNEYQVRMLLVNEIPGLLRCKLRRIDGEVFFYYDITSRQPLSRIFEHRAAGYEDIRAVVQAAGRTLAGIARYLLADEGLILDPELIYMDVETKEVSFCYLPFFSGDITEAFRSLSEYLLKTLDHEDEQAVLWGYRLYSGTIEENYSIRAVIEGVQEKSEKYRKERENSLPVEEKGKKDSKEKEKEIREEKLAVRQMMTGQEQLAKRENRKKKIRLGAVAVFGILGTGALLFLHALTLTQAGGIFFLGAGIFYYVCMGRKDERTGEKRLSGEKDGGLRQRWIKSREKRSSQARQKKEKCAGEIEGYDGYEKESCGGERIKYSGIEEEAKAQQFCKREIFQEEEICDFQEDSEEEVYGQTTLLGGGRKGACPMLISSNPDIRENAVIDKEKFVIGKLKGQVDMALNLPVISRIHAEIERKEGKYFLIDLNSMNGTYLNGERLEANEYRQLHTGDEIYFAGAGYYFKE